MGVVVLSTTGSLGDFLPFLAVARGLRDRGHRVRLALPTEFRGAAHSEGFDDVVPAGWEISPSTLAALDVDWSKAAGLLLLRKALNELVLPELEAAYQALSDASEDADLVVGHANQVVAPMIAERTGVRWAVLSLFPMLVPTTRGLPGTPVPQLPGPFRRAGNVAAMGIFKLGSRALFSDRAFNTFRAAHGFGRRHAYFLTCAFDSDLYIAPVPPEFVARPSDWPANAQLSGFCPGRLSTAAVPTEVEDFLADGEPPVLVTLGSAPSSTSADRLTAIAAALDKRGLRGLFLVGREELIVGPLRDRGRRRDLRAVGGRPAKVPRGDSPRRLRHDGRRPLRRSPVCRDPVHVRSTLVRAMRGGDRRRRRAAMAATRSARRGDRSRACTRHALDYPTPRGDI